MKRAAALLTLLSVMICLCCGCADSNVETSALNYVQLCDYRSLIVPYNDVKVSESDIETAIQMQFCSLNIETDNLSDEIALQYLNCENADDFRLFVKREIVENRFYESLRDMILNYSKVLDFPASSEKYVEKMLNIQKSIAEDKNVELNEYLEDYYGMTKEEFCDAALCGYGDILIFRAIAEKENYIISTEERKEIVKKTAISLGLSSDEVYELYGEEYFDCLLYESFLKDLLTGIYSEGIDSLIFE